MNAAMFKHISCRHVYGCHNIDQSKPHQDDTQQNDIQQNNVLLNHTHQVKTLQNQAEWHLSNEKSVE